MSAERRYRGPRPTLTTEQAIELLRIRAQVNQIPKPEEVAERLGISVRDVRRYLYGADQSIPKQHRRLLHDVG